jgi:hypothetical protein
MTFYLRWLALCCLATLTALLWPGVSKAAYAQSSLAAASAATSNAGFAAAPATELLVFDLNRPVTTKDRGFPGDRPPRPAANGDWTTPVNFAEGRLYIRVEIRSQPRPKDMRLQFCMWQYDYTLETCGKQTAMRGVPGTVVTWSQRIQDMWKKDGNPLDWKNPRQRYAVAIKNSAKLPVSNYLGWNWHGENPGHWYPLDMRFTVVVVAKGATFGGWDNYVNGANIYTTIDLDSTEIISAEVEHTDTFGSGLNALPPEEENAQMQGNFLFLPLVQN